jgi:hypothetical protein
LSREYLREFSKKIEMAVMVHSGAWGKLIHEKNQKSKISWHCPFKYGTGTVIQNSVVEPDPHGTALILLSWSRIRRYWKCGSGPRSKEINEMLIINLIFSLSIRI